MGLQGRGDDPWPHGLAQDELDRAEFERNLDVLGQDGYDLTWVFLNQKLHRLR